MACACKINQDIERINRYYSYNKQNREKKTRMSINRKDAARVIMIYVLLIPLLPIMFVGLVIFSAFSKNKRISIGKFLNFIHKTRNGREQQDI